MSRPTNRLGRGLDSRRGARGAHRSDRQRARDPARRADARGRHRRRSRRRADLPIRRRVLRSARTRCTTSLLERLDARGRRGTTTSRRRRRTPLRVPVCYGGELGPDLESVARQAKMSPEQVVAVHSSEIYRVFMLGFLPGFAYMGLVDSRIAAPRHLDAAGACLERIGRHRRPADGDLSRRYAGRMAAPGPHARPPVRHHSIACRSRSRPVISVQFVPVTRDERTSGPGVRPGVRRCPGRLAGAS